MALTKLELETAMRYVARGIIADGVNINDVGSVVRWMIEHPLPAKATYEAEVATQDAAEKQSRIIALQAELDKLEGGKV
jgi:hypothetical protein